jgi:hypothetical protein
MRTRWGFVLAFSSSLFAIAACGSPSNSGADSGNGGGRDAAGNGTDSGHGGTDSGPGHDANVMLADGGPITPPSLMGCRVFPPDNPWNQDVSGLPLSALNTTYIAAMSPGTHVHPDWGNWSTDHYGIPWLAGTGAPQVAFHWTTSWGNTESDVLACTAGGGNFCYPIPTTAQIEGGPGANTSDDRHVLYLDTAGAPNDCTLYEIYNAQNFTAAPWDAANGAIFHLGSNTLRPDQWTSADAAGLPILPGLVRFDEVMSGAIHHAMRFTMNNTQTGFIHPATHAAGSSSDASLPPMGLRLRLSAGFDTTPYSGPALVILQAMQRYGLILADNGSDWYVSGDSDDRWDTILDGIITALQHVHGSDFEVVDTGAITAQM